MSKVYLPNKASHDYSDAKRYGEIVAVTTGVLNKFATTQMYRIWKTALEDSEPEDYIALTGLNSFNCVGCAVFARKHGRLNLLIWRNDRYIARELIFEEDL